jgi:peptide/nickel transport system substrate-binding protein
MDPPVGGNGTTTEINWQTYEMPLQFVLEEQAVNGGEAWVQQGDLTEPSLATAIDVSPDGLTYTVQIREGVKFYPSGNEMTASDWLWSFDRILNMNVGFGKFFANSIDLQKPGRIIDDYTFEFTIESQNPMVSPVMAVIDIAILDSEVAKQHATEEDPWAHEYVNRNSIGTGPYYLKSFSESEVILEANPLYWGEQPFFKRLVWRHVPDVSDIMLLLRSGEADIGHPLPQKELDDLGADPSIKVLAAQTNEVDVLWMNTTIPPMDDQNFRRAVQHAIPYDTIIDTVYYGRAEKHDNMIMSEALGYVPGLSPTTQDLVAAEGFLAQSAYAGGTDLNILIRNDRAKDEEEALLIKDALGQIGINVTIDKQAVSAYFSSLAAAPAVVRSHTPWLDEGLWVGVLFFISNALSNNAQVLKDEIDAAYQMARTLDDTARAEAYATMQREYMEENPLSILARPNQAWAMSVDVQDFVIQVPVAPIYRILTRG